MRLGAEKRLVDAILDAEISTDEIADRATALGDTLAERLTVISKNLVKLRVNGLITKERAAYFYKYAYMALVLLGFTKVAQDVKDHGDDSVDKIAKLAKEYFQENPGASRMEVINKLEKEQRKRERGQGQS